MNHVVDERPFSLSPLLKRVADGDANATPKRTNTGLTIGAAICEHRQDGLLPGGCDGERGR